jgi:hypothetical protein
MKVFFKFTVQRFFINEAKNAATSKNRTSYQGAILILCAELEINFLSFEVT